MVRSRASLVCALILAACGARTPLTEPDDATSPPDNAVEDSAIDVPPTVDSPDVSFDVVDAPPDVPADIPRDAPPDAPLCRLVLRAGPVPVFEDSAGIFDRPQLTRRGDSYDAVATFWTERDDRPNDVRLARVDVGVGPPRIGPATRSTTAASGPAFVAALDDRLGGCTFGTDSSARSSAQFVLWVDHYAESIRRSIQGRSGACLSAARNEAGWLFAYRVDDTPSGWFPMIAGFSAVGSVTLAPTQANVLSPRAEVDVSIRTVRSGAVWVSASTAANEVELVRVRGATRTRSRIAGLFHGPTAPVAADWPYAADHVVIVGNSFSGLALAVIDPTGAVILRRSGLAFSMFNDVQPAVVSTSRGLFVAMVDYGDIVPSNGILRVLRVGPDGMPDAGTIEIATNRDAGLRFGGVSAATDGVTVAVHWARRANRGGVTDTQLIVLGCE